MSLLDAFGQDATCPLCGSTGAKKLLFFVKCPNRSCRNNSGGVSIAESKGRPASWLQAPETSRAIDEISREKPPARKKWLRVAPFDPSAATLKVRYKNFEDKEKTFDGDARTLHLAGAHVSLRVAPSGARIALAKERIQNLADVEAALKQNPQPSAKESRILKYHRNKGTTSAAYEELRKKYPNW